MAQSSSVVSIQEYRDRKNNRPLTDGSLALDYLATAEPQAETDNLITFPGPKPQPENKWWLLPNTGFNVPLEAKALRRLYQSQIAQGEDAKEAAQFALRETRGNLRGFWYEHLLLSGVVPNFVDLRLVNGQKRLVNSISGQSIVDGITDQERLGAVKEVMVNVEAELLKEEKDENGKFKKKILLFTSPDGDTGFASQGQKIKYSESETFGYQVNEDGTIESFTFVHDMTRGENRQLIAALGGIPPKAVANDLEDLANIVKTMVVIKDNNQITDLRAVLGKIEETKSTSYARKIEFPDGRVMYKQFDQMYDQLERGEQMRSIGLAQEAVIAQFEEHISEHPELLEIHDDQLERSLGITVLELASLVDGPTQSSDSRVRVLKPLDYAAMPESMYRDQLAYLASLPMGCNWTGKSIFASLTGSSIFESPLGPRAIYAEGAVAYGNRKGTCQNCRAENAEVGRCGWCNKCAPPTPSLN